MSFRLQSDSRKLNPDYNCAGLVCVNCELRMIGQEMIGDGDYHTISKVCELLGIEVKYNIKQSTCRQFCNWYNKQIDLKDKLKLWDKL